MGRPMRIYLVSFISIVVALACSKQNVADVPVYSYKETIKPIFQKRCAQCHNENWKDKNWLDYETAYKNRDKIRYRVWEVKNMPPSGDIPMIERVLIKKWVDKGAQK